MGRQLGQIYRVEFDSSELWKLERNHPESGQFSVFNWWLAAPLRRSLRSAILLLQPPSLPQYQSHFSFLCHKKISFHKLTICKIISFLVAKNSFCVPCPHHHHCSQAQGKVALTQFLGKPYSCINGSRKCPEFYFQTRKKWGRWGFQAKLVKNWDTRQIWGKLEILWPEQKEMPVQFSPNIVSHLLTLCLIK